MSNACVVYELLRVLFCGLCRGISTYECGEGHQTFFGSEGGEVPPRNYGSARPQYDLLVVAMARSEVSVEFEISSTSTHGGEHSCAARLLRLLG
ncbi:hypothetical protein C8J57DRAFT_1313116 [Mycena rebaudengoi]|nr:hypothetical protein C8J57DRAFT_1313116 [Mycena rebaudengoi]